MFDAESLWPSAYGAIVFGVLLIVSAVAMAVGLVDWRAIRELRAARKAAKAAEPTTTPQD